ncbi:hypothetical protein [Gryllotalpicola koreensis]|uniref:DUF222 domain-containing protein n=1 Tax=Gryllotalpicola koreensis TaxID=993086 RepID=A0ABP8A205_9MICO
MTDIQLPVERIPASQGTMIEQTRAVAEVAAAVKLAKEFPRDTTEVIAATKELCSRLAVAQRAFYEVPNRGAGLSVHIARELARIWGNLDYGVRELNRDDDKGVSELQAFAWDAEQNVRSTRSFIQPHERMVKGARKRLTDLSDIYLQNQNVAARAVRECIFSVIPGWLLAEAEATLRATLKNGDGKPIEQRRREAIAAFADLKVTQAQLEKRLNKSQAKWDALDVSGLVRVFTSITQDSIPVTEFFPDEVVQIPEVEQ